MTEPVSFICAQTYTIHKSKLFWPILREWNIKIKVWNIIFFFAQSAEAVEYTDCFSADG